MAGRGICRGVLLLVVLGLARGIASPSLLPQVADAQVGPCRSDPVVSLSDGSQIDLSATIADDVSDVVQVAYVLHGPVGTSVVSVLGTDGAMGLKETFSYYADLSPDTYDSATLVTTGAHHLQVTAGAFVTTLAAVGALSVSGYSGQTLRLHLAQ